MASNAPCQNKEEYDVLPAHCAFMRISKKQEMVACSGRSAVQDSPLSLGARSLVTYTQITQ